MKIALVGEGTYPHHPGGVSVWYDQLIRGLPEHRFEVVALVAHGREPHHFALPGNVGSVTSLPLWGPPPRRRRQRLVGGGAEATLRRFFTSLLLPPADGAADFAETLADLARLAWHEELHDALTSEAAVRLLRDAWRDHPMPLAPAAPSLHDALSALRLLEHALRPLAGHVPQADVVHATANGIAVLPALAAKWRHGTPIVLSEHGVYLREHYLHSRASTLAWPVRALYLSFLRHLCSLGYVEASAVVPCNAWNRRWEERLGADPGRIVTIHNGVDPHAFSLLEDEPALPSLAWVGRVDPVKDLETLLLAFRIVRDELGGATLSLFGTPAPGREPYLARCRRLAADLRLGEAARFEGAARNVRQAYASGQIVVLSSISEGLPYTVLEAMSCGRPCVASDVGGVGEAIGDAGLLVPPRQPAALAEACLRLLGDAPLRHRLGRAARSRVLARFTLEKMIGAYAALYRSVASGWAGQPSEAAG